MPVCPIDASLPAVPRSKGCLTCVARKTRCDGRRPTCRACETWQRACGGYRRQEVFLSEGCRSLGVASFKTKTIRVSRTACGVRMVPRGPATDRSPLQIVYFIGSFGGLFLQTPYFIIEIFRRYSASAAACPDDAALVVSDGYEGCAILAVRALAQAHFGTAQADAESVRRSIQSYGVALRAMSARLAELRRAEPELAGLSEVEWQHMAVSCLAMMFYELRMSPTSRNWQSHIRGLAHAIYLRGMHHAYSETNRQLLAFSRLFIILQTWSARQPNFLASDDWREKCSPIRSAWLEMKGRPLALRSPTSRLDLGLYHCTDALLSDAASIGSVMAQYDQLRGSTTTASNTDTLLKLYTTADTLLTRNEARPARWGINIREISLSSWLALHPDVAKDPTSGHFWSSINGGDAQAYFDTVLSFRTMIEYHSVTLYWTSVMSLRLLLCDMLALMAARGGGVVPGGGVGGDGDGGVPVASPQQVIAHHRVQLLRYARKAVQAICYATLAESRAAAPFFVATAFQLAVAVFAREKELLEAEGGAEDAIRRCERLRELAERYLQWAGRNKIPIKMDLHWDWLPSSAACLGVV